jgi:hypothetical protein
LWKSEISGNNLNNVRREASEQFRNKKREVLRDNINKLATKTKNIGDLFGQMLSEVFVLDWSMPDSQEEIMASLEKMNEGQKKMKVQMSSLASQIDVNHCAHINSSTCKVEAANAISQKNILHVHQVKT